MDNHVPPEYIGQLPVRQDIIVESSMIKKLKDKASNILTMGWTIEERFPNPEQDKLRWSKYKPNDYPKSENYAPFKNGSCTSSIVAKILPEYYGKPFTAAVYAMLYGFNPTRIRIVKYNEAQHCDAISGRITINLDKDENIHEISQEIRVCLPEHIENGYELECAARGVVPNFTGVWINGDVLKEMENL